MGSSIPSALPVSSSQSIVMKVVLSLAVIAASVLGALAASSSSTAPPATTLGVCPADCSPYTTTAAPTGSSTSAKPNPSPVTSAKPNPSPATSSKSSPSPATSASTKKEGPSAREASTTPPDCNNFIDGKDCKCPENSSSVVSFSMVALLLSSLV